MFRIDEDMTINITRGDTAYFTVTAEENGEKYVFRPDDVVRFKVTAKKDCANVAFQKDFLVEEECESVDILLTEEETKIGDVISKPKDYWYEVELNPYTYPQTIVGYDDDGAKIFKLYPEGKDIVPVEKADIPIVDSELDVVSTRPVQNQAVTRGMLYLQGSVRNLAEKFEETKKSVSDGKTEVATAITEKNIETATDATFAEMAENIRKIKVSGSGNATTADVLEGKTFTNDDGIEYEGTIPVRADKDSAVSISNYDNHLYYRINYGYYPEKQSDDERFDGITEVKYPLDEVNAETGYTDYINAVVAGLQHSGLGVTADTTAAELERILLAEYPEVSTIYLLSSTTGLISPYITSGSLQERDDNTLRIDLPNSSASVTGSIVPNINFKLYGSITFKGAINHNNSFNYTIQIIGNSNTYTLGTIPAEDGDIDRTFNLDDVNEEGYIKITATKTKDFSTTREITFDTISVNLVSPFEMAFESAKNLTTDTEGVRFYMTTDTYGDNWKVSEETTPSAIRLDSQNQNLMRYFKETDCDYFRAMGNGNDYVFEFTAPVSGIYSVDINRVLDPSGGYVNIYLNDELIAERFDMYHSTKLVSKFNLGNHRLKAGEFANKINIRTVGKSSGTNAYASIEGFYFDIPTV